MSKNVTPGTTGSSRLAEIRARMADGEPITLSGPPALVAAFVQKDKDIAWLLDEFHKMTMRERAAWDIIAEVGTGLTHSQVADLYAHLMSHYRRQSRQ